MISFGDSKRAKELSARAKELMDEVVIPKERELTGGTTISRGTVTELREAAQEYGVYAPQIEEEHGEWASTSVTRSRCSSRPVARCSAPWRCNQAVPGD